MSPFKRLVQLPLAVLLVLALAVGIGSTPMPAAPGTAPLATDQSLQQWSDLIWSSAKSGDLSRVEQSLGAMPSQAHGEGAQQVRKTYEQFVANGQTSQTKREASRNEAAVKMREFAAQDNLSQALVKAVEMQSLSHDLNAALNDADVQGLIARAGTELAQAKAAGDWLYAQELLFRLRTLYEDTDDLLQYYEYKSALEQVNQRVALLFVYAPRALHDLAAQQAARFGDEPVKAFNPAMANDWRERVKEVDVTMLKPALAQSAGEHIESGGWKPLLTGGLQSLRTFATTPALSETFPNLADHGKVDQWVSYLDDQLRWAATTTETERRIAERTDRVLRDELPALNQQTLQIPESVLYHEFGDGALGMLDDYSEIIWPDKLRRFQQSTQGHFVGVGILIRHDDKRDIQVVNPLEGSPAYFAGVKPDDRIVEVDGIPTLGWSLNDAVDRITGKQGTEVLLGLRREGAAEIVEIPIRRDLIKIPSVNGWWKKGLNAEGDPEWDWYIDPISRVAYVKLTEFSEDTSRDLKAAWREIIADGMPNGLILDLRYNPGGLLTSAVEIANLFMTGGLIVKGEDRLQDEQWRHEAKRRDAMIAKDNVPVVILINKGSASASEIVAGALQVHGKALIVGERSYGKGSVQTVHQIAPDALLKLTTQYYRLPGANGAEGRLVHKRPGSMTWGIEPDLKVEMTPDQVVAAIELRQAADIIDRDLADPALDRVRGKEKDKDKGGVLDELPKGQRPDINDLLTKGIDPQLETALLLLQVKALADQDTRHAQLN